MRNQLKTILIVGEDLVTIDLISSILSDSTIARFVVVTADDTGSALAIAQFKLPDIILTNGETPAINGIGLIGMLKQVPLFKEIPVIILLAGTAHSCDMALSEGAIDYVRKPIDKTELTARIRSVLKMANCLKETTERSERVAAKEKSDLNKSIKKLENKLDDKERELVSNISFLIHVENEKSKYMLDLNNLHQYLNEEGKRIFAGIRQQFNQRNGAISILELENKFDTINRKFYESIDQENAGITKSEKILLAYFSMNLSPAEIAVITLKTANSINVNFSRIRAKLNVKTNIELRKHLRLFSLA